MTLLNAVPDSLILLKIYESFKVFFEKLDFSYVFKDAYLECFDSYARKYSIPPTKKEKKNK